MKILVLGLLMASLVIFVTIAAFCGPVALWTLDEGSGDKIVDRSGNGNDGVIAGNVGGAWGEGKFNGALYFDGGKKGVVHHCRSSLRSKLLSEANIANPWILRMPLPLWRGFNLNRLAAMV